MRRKDWGIFGIHSSETWHVLERFSAWEHLQVPNRTGPGHRTSKRPLWACNTLHTFKETSLSFVKRSSTLTRSSLVTRRRVRVMFDEWKVSLHRVVLQNACQQRSLISNGVKYLLWKYENPKFKVRNHYQFHKTGINIRTYASPKWNWTWCTAD